MNLIAIFCALLVALASILLLRPLAGKIGLMDTPGARLIRAASRLVPRARREAWR